MAKTFDITAQGVVTGNHSAIRGETKIQLSGQTGYNIHAYKGGVDHCQNLVGSGNCPLPLDKALLIRNSADEGTWQLGTDPANNGGSGQAGPVGPLSSNGTITVGSG